MRREYRFPRWMIVLMLLILAQIVIAIDGARRVVAGDLGLKDNAWRFFEFPALILSAMLVLGAIGYAILRMLGPSGADRLSNIQISQRQR
jgi:hypothetical protein